MVDIEITEEQRAQALRDTASRVVLPPPPRAYHRKQVAAEPTPVPVTPISDVVTSEPVPVAEPVTPEAEPYIPEPKAEREIAVHLREPHPRQREFVECTSKRIIIRAGRRSGKTVGIAIKSVVAFLRGRRVLYAAPTSEQTDRYWYEITTALAEPIRAGYYALNKSERWIERPGTLNRIKAKTAWDADSLRGDYADLLIFDEWQLSNEDAWEVVGAPMLMDNNGDAVFIYTPPSLRSAGVSKAHDPRHAAKLFAAARADTSDRWKTFHFTSLDNPYLSTDGIAEVTRDMSRAAFRQEILAEDDELAVSRLVYGIWDESKGKIPRFEIPAEWPVWSGHDFGTANPAGLFWARVRLPLPTGAPSTLRQGDLIVFREYLPGAGKSTALNVEAFQDICRGRRVQASAGGSHQEEETRQGYTRHGWHIQEPPIVGLRPQVDRVLAVMESGRWHVFEDCVHYLAEVNSCQWKYDKEGNRTNDIDGEARFHLCACARYGLALPDFTPETVGSNDYAEVRDYRPSHNRVSRDSEMITSFRRG